MKKQLQNPPKGARKILHWYCSPERLEEIEGDIHEVFTDNIERYGIRKARIYYWFQVIRCFKPYAWKRKNEKLKISGLMVSNYLVTAIRRMRKEKNYAIINSFGLTLGILSFMLISLYILNELSYDKFLTQRDRLYRVVQIIKHAGEEEHEAMTSIHLGPAIMDEIPEVEEAVTIWGGADSWVDIEDKRFFESDFILASENFFKVFNYEFISGDSASALNSPFSAVITKTLALKYFGHTDVLNQVLSIDYYGSFTITAVVDDPPSNTHLPYTLILTHNFEKFLTMVHPNFVPWFNSWEGHPGATYVMLREGSSSEVVEGKLNSLLPKHKGSDWQPVPYYLQSVKDIHFSTVSFGVIRTPGGDIKKIYTLATIGIFLLLIAIINYVNLTTATVSNRFKELGVRRTLGANKNQIYWQFIIESLLISLIAIVVSIGLIIPILPYFNEIIGKELVIDSPNLIKLMSIVFPIIMVMAIFSGFVPAWKLSRIETGEVLKGPNIQGGQSIFRNTLAIVQFAIAFILLVGTIVVSKQLAFIGNKEIGFEKENILVMEINGGGVRNNYQSFVDELMGHSQIHDVGAMSRIIGGSREPMIIELNQNNDTSEEGFAATYFGFDNGALKIANLSLIAGKGFTGNKNIDSASVIINETTAKLLISDRGISDVIGQQLVMKEDGFKVTVIGVVKDFHYQSMHQKIGPLVIGHITSLVQGMDNILIKFSGNPKPVIDHLEELHVKFEPHAQITIDFLDDLMAEIYQEDLAFKKIFTLGALLTMFIASLGIIGLSAYTAETRNKEFGIRRILGASVMQVLRLQSKSFLLIVLFSNLIAAPLAWWIFSKWLEEFSYRTTLGVVDFVTGSLILLFLSLAVVNLTSYASVKRNPIYSLRDE